MKMLSGTCHQNCSAIRLETSCPHSTAEDVVRRQGCTSVNCPAAIYGIWISQLVVLIGLFSSMVFTRWKVFLSGNLCPIPWNGADQIGMGKSFAAETGLEPRTKSQKGRRVSSFGWGITRPLGPAVGCYKAILSASWSCWCSFQVSCPADCECLSPRRGSQHLKNLIFFWSFLGTDDKIS